MYLGIDLGTSNSAIVGYRENGPVLFKTPEGHDVMPSSFTGIRVPIRRSVYALMIKR